MHRSYRAPLPRWWQTVSDAQVSAIVALLVLGVWSRRPVLAIGVGASLALSKRLRRLAIAGVLCGVLGCALGQRAWSQSQPDRLGPYVGVARLLTDPTPRAGALQVVVEIEGQRFEAFARGSPRRRLTLLLAGEYVWIEGQRAELTGTNAHRAAIRHVVGRLDLKVVGDVFPGSPFDRASNRIRRLLADGASELRVPENALFAGLVIGDDRNEPIEMVQQFRSSGMSHLTAVSGQNVAFVLAAAAPLLRRLRGRTRWMATMGLIAWFIALTRFEPSVLRAGFMAAISATGYLLGRERPPSRVLPLAVGMLVVIDPMLVWSVGFWLSVGATAGVGMIAPLLVDQLPGPAWLRVPASVTIGAQIGVAPISLAVFGSLPLVSIGANLLAVPVAGFVMLYGLPAGILAGYVGGLPAALIQLPCALGTRWVAMVAALASRLEPPAPWPPIGWGLLALGVIVVYQRRRRSFSVASCNADVVL